MPPADPNYLYRTMDILYRGELYHSMELIFTYCCQFRKLFAYSCMLHHPSSTLPVGNVQFHPLHLRTQVDYTCGLCCVWVEIKAYCNLCKYNNMFKCTNNRLPKDPPSRMLKNGCHISTNYCKSIGALSTWVTFFSISSAS